MKREEGRKSGRKGREEERKDSREGEKTVI